MNPKVANFSATIKEESISKRYNHHILSPSSIWHKLTPNLGSNRRLLKVVEKPYKDNSIQTNMRLKNFVSI